jgi:phosphoribosylaminoimidazole carboxylase
MTSDRRKIGILGGGQLAMMMTQSAKDMGYEVYVLDPTPDCPASHVGARHMVGSFKDRTIIYKFVNDFKIDVLTYDIESVNVDALIEIVEKSNIQIEIHPNPHILKMIQNKWTQHEFYRETCLPATQFESVNIWRPHFENGIVLKTKYGGYDGNGVWVINSVADFNKVIGDSGLPLSQFYAEEKVMIQKELALIMSIDKRGKISFYHVVELTQENGICVSTKTPADISTKLTAQIRGIGESINIKLKQKYGAYVGILAVELFLTMDNQILINEISPRVHNSGHFTIEGCKSSQFTNHIRTIMGMVSGDCCLIKPNITVHMTNILAGKNYPEDKINYSNNSKSSQNKIATTVDSYHWYHKKPKNGNRTSYKPLRKLGHYTMIENLHFENINTTQLNYWDMIEKTKSTTKYNVITNTTIQRTPIYVIMGSSSDLPYMKPCIELFDRFYIQYTIDIVSAHRSPKWMYEFANMAEESADIKVIIACAGGAASLPSMVSSLTPCIPVIGVPIPNGTLLGQDALYSIVQVPEGVPVLTMGIGRSKNAAISALQILGRKDILKQLEKENLEKVKRQRNEDVPEFLRNLNYLHP